MPSSPSSSVTSGGDVGNGFLASVGVVHALYHRERTGEGDFVSTSLFRQVFGQSLLET